MTELQFRIDLYDPRAVSLAVDAFSAFAQLERERRDDVEVVRVTVPQGSNEADVAGELANYVLGATVDGLGDEPGKAGPS
jgi:hypothetical protein